MTIWPAPYRVQVFSGGTPPYPITNVNGNPTVYPYYPANVPSANFTSPNNPCYGQVLMLEQAPLIGNVPLQTDNPTSWFWNIRIGDRIQIGDFGQYYTVVGPMTVSNPELFVNDGQPGVPTQLQRTYADQNNSQTFNVEYLFLVNGKDDDNDGFIDNGFDGIDDGRGIVTSGPGVTPQTSIVSDWDGKPDTVGEWETETWLSTLARHNTAGGNDAFYQNGSVTSPTGVPQPMPYVISRRPVASPGARETSLPRDVVIDLTTWNTTRERSRLPVDPQTHTVDILLNPTGQIVFTTVYSSPTSMGEGSMFCHFWLSERQDVFEAVVAQNVPYNLPMLRSAPNYPANADLTPRFLIGERALVTLFGRTGQLSTSSAELFDGADVNRPFYDSQLGAREPR